MQEIKLQEDELIKNGYMDDLEDNLFHSSYNIKHLKNLLKQNVDLDSNEFKGAYRSFEGEVFENFVYERLLRYAKNNPHIKKFIAKNSYSKSFFSNSSLMLNKKGQIVYKVRYKDLSEFDALIFMDNKLYFVEITLSPLINNLRDRLPKKKSLLELLFPEYEAKALIVVLQNTLGLSTLPSYCTVWKSKGIDSKPIFDYLISEKKRQSKILSLIL